MRTALHQNLIPEYSYFQSKTAWTVFQNFNFRTEQILKLYLSDNIRNVDDFAGLEFRKLLKSHYF